MRRRKIRREELLTLKKRFLLQVTDFVLPFAVGVYMRPFSQPPLTAFIVSSFRLCACGRNILIL